VSFENSNHGKTTDSRNSLPPLKSRQPGKRGHADRGVAVASIAAIIVVLAAVGVAWYTYPGVRQYANQIARVPGLEDSMKQVGEQLDGVKRELGAWPDQWKTLQERVEALDQTLKGDLRRARAESQGLMRGVQERLHAEFTEREKLLEARLNELQTKQESEEIRTASLQEEITSFRTQLSELRQGVAVAEQNANRDVGDLQRRVSQGENELATVATALKRDRVDFEITKHATRKIAPGVLARVSHTDIRQRRFSGWIVLVPEGRTLWIRDQSVQQPFIFYGGQDRRPKELVITHITREGTAGYLLLPAGEREQASEASNDIRMAQR